MSAGCRDPGTAPTGRLRTSAAISPDRARWLRWGLDGFQDNRLNCVGVRSDRFTLGLASRRPWRWDVRKDFNTEEAGRTTEGHGAECKLRFARSALNPYSVALVVLPASSVLKFFLDCGRHMFPRLSEATADSSDCPVNGSPTP